MLKVHLKQSVNQQILAKMPNIRHQIKEVLLTQVIKEFYNRDIFTISGVEDKQNARTVFSLLAYAAGDGEFKGTMNKIDKIIEVVPAEHKELVESLRQIIKTHITPFE